MDSAIMVSVVTVAAMIIVAVAIVSFRNLASIGDWMGVTLLCSIVALCIAVYLQ